MKNFIVAIVLGFCILSPRFASSFEMDAEALESLPKAANASCLPYDDCWEIAVQASLGYFQSDAKLFNIYYQYVGAKGEVNGEMYIIDICFSIPGVTETLQKTYYLDFSDGYLDIDHVKSSAMTTKCE